MEQVFRLVSFHCHRSSCINIIGRKMLKCQTGFSITTKSVKAKLLRSGFDMQPTKAAYNELVHFYFLLIVEAPQGLSILTKEDGGWRYYELLTANQPRVKSFPSPMKRAAIRPAIGVYQTWSSTLRYFGFAAVGVCEVEAFLNPTTAFTHSPSGRDQDKRSRWAVRRFASVRHQKWLNRPKRMKHHKPPVHPKVFNFNPQYDEGMWKEDELGITN